MLLLSYLNMICSLCTSKNILGTTVGNIKIETQDFKMEDLMGSVLDLLLLTKKENYEEGMGFIKTAPWDELCSHVGDGVDLQDIGLFNKTFNVPVLTSSIIVGSQVLIRGKKRTSLVHPSLLGTLLKSVGV